MRFQPQSLTPDRSSRHFFGGELRRHREAAKLSLVQLAKIVNSSKSTLARIETAELMPPPDLPVKLDMAFGFDGFFERVYALARREAHPDQYRRYMDFEAEAEVIETYDPQGIPGLLQTRQYASTYLGCQETLTDEQLEQRVEARLARQSRLYSPSPPFCWTIIDESALRRRFGDPDTMQKQLSALYEQVDAAHSKVQVVPFSAGLHSLMGGTLILLTGSDGSVVAYEEGIEVGRLYEDSDAVKGWRKQYEVLRANALSLTDSAELIREAMEDCKPWESHRT